MTNNIDEHTERLVAAIVLDFKKIPLEIPKEYEDALKKAIKTAFVSERMIAYMQAAKLADDTPARVRLTRASTLHKIIGAMIRQNARKELGLPEPDQKRNSGNRLTIIGPDQKDPNSG